MTVQEKIDAKIRLFDIMARESDEIEDWTDLAKEVNDVFDKINTYLS